jgi:hypothetical protein
MAKQNKTNKEDKILPFEQQFVDVWFTTSFNGRLAYKQLRPNVTMESAEQWASVTLAQPRVKEYIEQKQEQIRQKEEIKLSDIVSKLKLMIDEVDNEGDERDANGRLVQRKDRKSQLAAIAQLSKIAGFETKKMDVTTNGKDITQEIKIKIIRPNQEE